MPPQNPGYVCMSRRELKALQVENTELTTGNRSRRVMNGDKFRTELAKARDSKDDELKDLHSKLNEAKAESDLPKMYGCWSSRWRESVYRRS